MNRRRFLARAAGALAAAIPMGGACVPYVGSRRGQTLEAAAPSVAPTRRIAFGSCNRADFPQPMWAQVLANQPDVWVWLGDIVYADTRDMAVMRQHFARQMAVPAYQDFVARVPIIGVWDDHDYGANDAGKEYPMKAQSQQVLLDFLGEPAESPRRRQEGVYTAYTYGPPGRQVKVLLLDTRYHRDPIGSFGGILGEAQWAWLERELRESTAQVHVVGSSIQVLPEEHGAEKWQHFPAERERLFRLIGQTRAPGVIFISGDRHLGEMSRMETPHVSYPLYEVTSSGLTHSWLFNPRETNRHRLGEQVITINFGLIELDWEGGAIVLQVRDARNGVRLEQRVALADLRPSA